MAGLGDLNAQIGGLSSGQLMQIMGALDQIGPIEGRWGSLEEREDERARQRLGEASNMEMVRRKMGGRRPAADASGMTYMPAGILGRWSTRNIDAPMMKKVTWAQQPTAAEMYWDPYHPGSWGKGGRR